MIFNHLATRSGKNGIVVFKKSQGDPDEVRESKVKKSYKNLPDIDCYLINLSTLNGNLKF